jgi:hypothetical protein
MPYLADRYHPPGGTRDDPIDDPVIALGAPGPRTHREW